MKKNIFISATLLLIVVFSVMKTDTVFAVATKTAKPVTPTVTTKSKPAPAKVALPAKPSADDHTTDLATATFNKLIDQVLPKDKLKALLNFSNQLTYDPDKTGLQMIYIPAATDGSGTYFSATNLSASSFNTDTAAINSATVNNDLSVTGSISAGNASFAETSVQKLTVGTAQLSGITIYDRTTQLPVCIFSDNTTLQIASGACPN
ncbi:MAG: hypothetical protein NT098_03455 [Candidatus Parcubacteria bacterium]|nr:hypothetical protein [Candidatus Parcubacteria bacterium]